MKTIKKRGKDSGKSLLPFKKALSLVLAGVTWKMPEESVGLKNAWGRVLREDIKAGFNIPPFDKSAMDGYAVKAEDIKGASDKSPVVLKVTQELPAGKSPRTGIKKGEAARIMTGAVLPKGADSVVMVEYTKRDDAKRSVHIMMSVPPGKNVGKAGEDVKKGELVLEAGTRIGPAHLGMLAALGRSKVRVSRKPKVAIISTGDEVQVPGKPLGKGQIYDANGYSLLGLALERGCDARFLGIARDRPAELKKKIAAARHFDVVVMTGGVSVGDYDFVTELLRSHGITEIFYKTKIQPGKPTFVGVKGKRIFFGLPGNPVSCMVCFELFARPALDKMSAKKSPGMAKGKAVMDIDFKVRPGRQKFLRGNVTGQGPEIRVRPAKNQKSGVLASMLDADVLIDLPGEVKEIRAGTTVDILWL